MEMTERGGFSKPEDRTMKFTQPEQQRGTRLKKKILRINGIKKKQFIIRVQEGLEKKREVESI